VRIAKPQLCICAGAAFLLIVTAAFALQEPVEEKGTIHYAPAIAAQSSDQHHFSISIPGPEAGMFFAMGGKVVKGAPYSAEVITETSQVLGDGNRIVQKTSATVYRDSEGRTRREQTLRGIGAWASGETHQFISIHDPVAGVTYMLDPVAKTVRELVTEMHMSGDNTMQFKIQGAGKSHAGFVAMGGGGVARAGAVMTGGAVVAGVPATGTPVVVHEGNARQGESAVESLGRQTVGGVLAEGTRTTITIPAGSIGNERPIEITDEQWYSADLQMMVMTVHDDPRFGRTVYQVTNISRSEPSRSLFEVPSDYSRSDVPAPGVIFHRKPSPQ
jgi:hypothetical protein